MQSITSQRVRPSSNESGCPISWTIRRVECDQSYAPPDFRPQSSVFLFSSPRSVLSREFTCRASFRRHVRVRPGAGIAERIYSSCRQGGRSPDGDTCGTGMGYGNKSIDSPRAITPRTSVSGMPRPGLAPLVFRVSSSCRPMCIRTRP